MNSADRLIDGLEMNTANNTEIGSVNQQQLRVDGEPPDAEQALAAEAAQRQALPQPNQFGGFEFLNVLKA